MFHSTAILYVLSSITYVKGSNKQPFVNLFLVYTRELPSIRSLSVDIFPRILPNKFRAFGVTAVVVEFLFASVITEVSVVIPGITSVAAGTPIEIAPVF